jgi:hypothetical protein
MTLLSFRLTVSRTLLRFEKTWAFIVPDRRCRILKVILVRRLITWVLGIWRGEGLGKGEKGEVSLQAT